MIYLDHAAATQPLPCALDAVNLVLRDAWANPNSAHDEGQKARAIVESSRESVARCLNCKPSEVHFCSSASEAAAWVSKTLYMNCYNIATPKWEHDAIWSAPRDCERMYTPKLYDNGLFQMLANNETGEIYDVSAARRENPGALIATDATAAVGQIPVDFADLGADYLFADAMKFGGIPGCAFLIAKEGSPLSNLMHRPTPPTALIAAMAAALEHSCKLMGMNRSYISALRIGMVSFLNCIPGVMFNAYYYDGDYVLPGICNVSFDGVEGTALAGLLSREGVMVSTGAACHAGQLEPSRVLLSMGYDEERARSAIRISIGAENSAEDIRRASLIICQCVEQLRSVNGKKEEHHG